MHLMKGRLCAARKVHTRCSCSMLVTMMPQSSLLPREVSHILYLFLHHLFSSRSSCPSRGFDEIFAGAIACPADSFVTTNPLKGALLAGDLYQTLCSRICNITMASKKSPELTDKDDAPSKPLPLLPRRQRAISEPHYKRNPSFSDRLRNILPSQRPERGGTMRKHGFWEQNDAKEASDIRGPQHLRTGSRQSRQSETGDSDRIVRWNTAKELPKKRIVQRAAHTRAASLGIETLMALSPNRRRGCGPREVGSLLNPLSKAAAREGGGQEAVNRAFINQASEREREVATAADRRLSQARRIIEAKREKRRVRRSLKESGDYLGVQGINPETGQLDVVTPSDSEHSALSLETEQKIDTLRQIMKSAPPSHSTATARAEREIKKIILREQDKILRLEQEKQALERAQNRIKWRRHTKQWSSAQEPNLSPIAQSNKDMSPASCRQPAGGKSSREGILIDLGSPDISPLDQHVSPQNEQDSTTRSGSSGTIVRTPHKSTVDLSLAAQELFKNGISFDSPDQLNSKKETNTQYLSFETTFDSLSFMRRDQDDAPTSHQFQTRSRSTAEATNLKISPVTHDDVQAHPDDSFLDIRVEEKVDPGGLQERLGMDKTAMRQSPLPPTSPASPNGRQKMPQRRSPGVLRNFAQDLMTNPKRSPNTVETSLESRLQIPFGGSQLEECDITFLLEPLVNNQSPILESKIYESQTPMALHWDGDVETVFGENAYLPTPMGSQNLEQRTENKIQSDLKTLRNQLAQLDQSDLRPYLNSLEPKQPEPTTAQNAIQDITNKGEEVMGESASTTITTTIGFDPARSLSNQHPGKDLLVGHTQSRQSELLTYTSPNALEYPSTFPMKPIRNTLPSAIHPVEALVTDVSSVRHLGATKQRTQQLAKREVTAKAAPPQCTNTSPTSTSTGSKDQHVEDGQLQTSDGRPVKVSRKTIDKSACPDVHELRASDPKVEPKRQKLARLWRERGPPPPPATVRWTRAKIDRIAEDPTMRIPGSYPNHLDAEDDIASLFKRHRQESLRSSYRAKMGGLRDATIEVSQTVHINGVWLLKLY